MNFERSGGWLNKLKKCNSELRKIIHQKTKEVFFLMKEQSPKEAGEMYFTPFQSSVLNASFFRPNCL